MNRQDTTFPLGRLIAHAGGALDGRKYTNGAEAFERSAKVLPLIEMDICEAADGLIVAHDGLEHAYGLKKPFNEVKVANFRTRKFAGALQAMSVRDLFERLQDKRTNVILDIKTKNESDFGAALKEISGYSKEFNVMEKIIVQVYSSADYDAAKTIGLSKVMVALWKNFPNVWEQECRNCIEYCFGQSQSGFTALSLAARHVWRDDDFVGTKLSEYVFGKSPMVFLHGQPEAAERSLLSRGFGLFSHNAASLSAEYFGLLPVSWTRK